VEVLGLPDVLLYGLSGLLRKTEDLVGIFIVDIVVGRDLVREFLQEQCLDCIPGSLLGLCETAPPPRSLVAGFQVLSEGLPQTDLQSDELKASYIE
jgi:hypothetical protein